MSIRRLHLSTALEKLQLNAIKRRASSNYLCVLNYHRLKTDDPVFETRFDDNVFGLTVSEFESHVAFLKENAQVISLNELQAFPRHRQKFKKPCVLITFDDGYKDSYILGFPILKKYKMPATFFIPTMSLLERRVGWWDQIAYVLKKAKIGKKITISKPIFREIIVGEDRSTLKKRIFELIKNNLIADQEGFLDYLADSMGVNLPALEEQDSELMTVADLKEMIADGMDIGSHTHSHRILSVLNEDQQRWELAYSKHILEEILDVEISSISYPVGRFISFNAITQKGAKELNYKFGFSFYSGFNEFKKLNLFDIRRTGPMYNELHYLSAMLAFPSIFCRPILC